MNNYAEEFKKNIESIDKYVEDTIFKKNISESGEKIENNRNIFSFKSILWFLAISIIAISIVTFITQTVLLLADNIKGKDSGELVLNDDKKTEEEKKAKEALQNLYIRADIHKDIFSTSTENINASSSSLSNNTNLKIKIEDIEGNFLSPNLNKNAENSLITIDNEKKYDNYSIVEKAIYPTLSSKAYLMADLETGEIIIEKNSDTIYPLASVSKIMTALIAREKMNMQDIAIVSRDASRAYGGQGGLALGEKIILGDLLFPLLMESSNDAAEVFADSYGHAKFIEEMNKKAVSLNMKNTYYGDPSGLDPKNTATPKDMLTLARYIYKKDPEIYNMTRVKQFSIKNHTWYNRNRQLPLQGFIGGKNGYIDQALQTTVSLFEVNLAKGGVRKIAIVILKSSAKDVDVNKLLTFAKKSVIYKTEGEKME